MRWETSIPEAEHASRARPKKWLGGSRKTTLIDLRQD
jgi:hypothetical protein